MENKTIQEGVIFLNSGHIVRFKFCEKCRWVQCEINSNTYASPITLECKNYDGHANKSVPESIQEDMQEFIKYYETSCKDSHECPDVKEKRD